MQLQGRPALCTTYNERLYHCFCLALFEDKVCVVENYFDASEFEELKALVEIEILKVENNFETDKDIEGQPKDFYSRFKGIKYLTEGIHANLQQIIWNLIENMDVLEKNHLQEFRLKVDEGKQVIIHTQDNYRKVYKLNAIDVGLYNGVVWVQDALKFCTMMKREEKID